MTTRQLPWTDAPTPEHRVRQTLAALLQALAGVAHVLAARLLQPAPRRYWAQAEPQLEFHAEAGAPEGALYVDGQLVGHVVGVTRL